ncbi:unnamed protein product [Macrosiphum euphorbiae]|uniref:Uncharacterized protein n=1 Tax=Macrosiphum euphorbiae TaxID=13131 RepID=A0AAV0XKA1_9HEMI|nr:unnamed protein product [Macrosiphum euphorbiae]
MPDQLNTTSTTKTTATATTQSAGLKLVLDIKSGLIRIRITNPDQSGLKQRSLICLSGLKIINPDCDTNPDFDMNPN